jgi:HKD family nuclease
VHNAIGRLAADGCNVYIAVAFFTESSVVESLIANGCHVRLVFRLGFPTNPSALQELMELPNVEVRYFTGHSFHPKIYIFGEKAALVGWFRPLTTPPP